MIRLLSLAWLSLVCASTINRRDVTIKEEGAVDDQEGQTVQQAKTATERMREMAEALNNKEHFTALVLAIQSVSQMTVPICEPKSENESLDQGLKQHFCESAEETKDILERSHACIHHTEHNSESCLQKLQNSLFSQGMTAGALVQTSEISEKQKTKIVEEPILSEMQQYISSHQDLSLLQFNQGLAKVGMKAVQKHLQSPQGKMLIKNSFGNEGEIMLKTINDQALANGTPNMANFKWPTELKKYDGEPTIETVENLEAVQNQLLQIPHNSLLTASA